MATVAQIAIALILVAGFSVAVSRWREPDFVNYQELNGGDLSEAQEQTLTMAKELNSYLISTTTLIFGALGWYLTQYRAAVRPGVTRVAFFTAIGLMSVAAWYAYQTYAQIVSELAQDALAVTPGQSRILYYFELESAACGAGALLMLMVFADAVTRKRKD